ncbi:MAG TPA: inorganic phosphate transporter [bacterium]|nr:inorganic phosphate transporter [bacterium]
MASTSLILGLSLIVGLYMAWNIGANDVANAMGTSVGSGAVTFRQAVVLAGICELLGAVLVGGHVTQTIRNGIVDPAVFATDVNVLIAGMLSALVGAALWLHIATYFGLPVSTTHSIVGSVFGFGLLYGGAGSVHWGKIGEIVLSWVISPVVGALIGFIVFSYIHHRVFKAEHPAVAAQRVAPGLVFPVITILVLSIFYKGLHTKLSFMHALMIAAALGIIGSIALYAFLKRSWQDCEGLSYSDQLKRVEGIFRYLQICTACYVAFAHGANDVANAVGPMAGIYAAIKTQALVEQAPVPVWILGVGAIGIVVGLATWGYKVIATIGEKITEMTPTRGFSAEFACATTVLACSKMGLPVSTTHTIVGSVVGVGLARGIASIDRKVILNIIYSWIITIPASAILCVLIFQIISRI